MTKVMIVEDDPAFLNRFCRILASEPEFEIFAAVRDGASAKESLARGGPDVLLVDLGLPDMSGIEIIRETAGRYPDADIMVVTMFGDEGHVLSSIEAGATGYVLKDSVPVELISLIKQLRAGGSPISPAIARLILNQLRPPAERACGAGFRDPAAPCAEGSGNVGMGHGDAEKGDNGAHPAADFNCAPANATLSARESEILSLIAKGFSFAEIGKVLTVSIHTVTTHVKNIYKKLAVHSRGEAVYEATRMGLLN